MHAPAAMSWTLTLTHSNRFRCVSLEVYCSSWKDIRFASYSVVRDPWEVETSRETFGAGNAVVLPLVELNGIEPSTSGLQSPRSPG